MKPINDIKPYAKNSLKSHRAVDNVAEPLEQYGFQQPIVVDRDMIIVVGHTRYRAAHKLNLKQVPVLVADTLTDDQVRAYRLMDNRSNENAQWDNTLLMEELQVMLDGITIQDVSYQSGFSESELNRLFRNDEDLLDQVRDVLTPETYSESGDVWILGRHRIVNGDSTASDTVATLLGTEKIDLVWEDAPYGVAYQTPNSMNHSRDYNELNNHKIQNDTLSGEQLDTFLDAHLQAVMPHVRPGASVYWCHDIRYNHQFKHIIEI